MASEDTGVIGLPRWKIATAALAATGAVGLGIWYYRNKRGSAGKDSKVRQEKNSDDVVPTNVQTPPVVQISGPPGPSSPAAKCDNAAGDIGKQQPVPSLEAANSAKEKGNKFYRGAKYDKAIDCYTQAIALWPEGGSDDKTLSTFYQNRAAAHEQLKNYEAVAADCTKALHYDAKYQKALARRAKASEALQDSQGALRDATAASVLDGFKSQETLMIADRALRQLAMRSAKLYSAEKQAVLPSRQTIRSYFEGFAFDPIVARLDSTIPDDTQQCPFIQAIFKLKSGVYDDVPSLCTVELSNESSQFVAEARLLRATFQILMGQGQLSRNDLTAVIESDEASKEVKVNALIKRASVSIQVFDEASALADFEHAEALQQENADVYYHRGLIHLLMEKVDEALKDFDRCISLNPHFAAARVQRCCTEYRLAMTLQSMSQLQAAMKSFEDLAIAFPDCCDGFVSYGQVLLENQQFEQAAEMFERAVKLEPDNANLYVHKGVLIQQWKGDSTACDTELQRAIKLDDKCELAYETLGSLAIQKGDIASGIEHFRKALPYAKSEVELSHLFSLIEAASTQLFVSETMGLSMPLFGAGGGF